MSELVPNGIYEHYKGNRYEVFGVGRHTETLEEVVMYQSLDGSDAMWARPLKMFLEEVEVDGVRQPRFVWLNFSNTKNTEDD